MTVKRYKTKRTPLHDSPFSYESICYGAVDVGGRCCRSADDCDYYYPKNQARIIQQPALWGAKIEI